MIVTFGGAYSDISVNFVEGTMYLIRKAISFERTTIQIVSLEELKWTIIHLLANDIPDSKVHWTNMGPIWGLAIWDI